MGATTIETITVTRPMKVIAFTCCSLTVVLLLASLSAADWVQSDGWREGLFSQCVKAGAPTPLPFDGEATPGCRRAHAAGYVRGAAALGIICFITDFFGTLLTGLGLRSTDPNKKYKYYRVAIYSLAVAVIALFLALIIYPTSFANDIAKDGDGIPDEEDLDDDGDGIADVEDTDDDNDGIPDDQDFNGHRRVWEFGFGFGSAWCSLILMFVSLVLLICDRESEEIFYKEREAEEGEGDEEA